MRHSKGKVMFFSSFFQKQVAFLRHFGVIRTIYEKINAVSYTPFQGVERTRLQ